MSTVAESPEKFSKDLWQETFFKNFGSWGHIFLDIALEANVPHYWVFEGGSTVCNFTEVLWH